MRSPPVRFGRVVGKDQRGFVSTDCTLIGGDSGGPLFDLETRVVGIHSSIGGGLDENNHSGVSNYKNDWDRLISGEVWGVLQINPMADPERPVMGFMNGAPVKTGVMIGQLVEHSPADLAGLKVGDILIRADGEKIEDFKGLLKVLSERKAGDLVEIGLLRAGEFQEVELRLARAGDLFEFGE